MIAAGGDLAVDELNIHHVLVSRARDRLFFLNNVVFKEGVLGVLKLLPGTLCGLVKRDELPEPMPLSSFSAVAAWPPFAACHLITESRLVRRSVWRYCARQPRKARKAQINRLASARMLMILDRGNLRRGRWVIWERTVT